MSTTNKADCPTASMAEKVADEILGNYSVLAHDGSGLRGEHYWVREKELAEHLESFFRANPQQPSKQQERKP